MSAQGPWWIVGFSQAGRGNVIRFKIIGDDDAFWPTDIEQLAEPTTVTAEQMQAAAERFCEEHAEVIRAALALRKGKGAFAEEAARYAQSQLSEMA